MNREDIVTVRSRDGGAIAFSAGQKHSLKLAAGEIADKWADGSPITRAEFENVLAPHGPFEIAGEVQLPAANQSVDRIAADQEE